MTEDNFTEDQLASERANRRAGVRQPNYTSLIAHMERWGPEGVVESAVHLPEDQFEKLALKAKKMKYDKRTKKWAT